MNMSLIETTEQQEVLDNTTIYDITSNLRKDLIYNEQGDIQRDLWVVFYTPKHLYWWNKHLKKGYSHCLTLQWDGFMWIVSNHTAGHTEVFTLPVEEWDKVKMFIEWSFKGEDFSYVHVNTSLSSDNKVRTKCFLAPYTCTESVKATLGLRDYCIFTPYQLYKHFVSKNMIVKEPEEN